MKTTHKFNDAAYGIPLEEGIMDFCWERRLSTGITPDIGVSGRSLYNLLRRGGTRVGFLMGGGNVPAFVSMFTPGGFVKIFHDKGLDVPDEYDTLYSTEEP
jgi:hypothetical protein